MSKHLRHGHPVELRGRNITWDWWDLPTPSVAGSTKVLICVYRS